MVDGVNWGLVKELFTSQSSGISKLEKALQNNGHGKERALGIPLDGTYWGEGEGEAFFSPGFEGVDRAIIRSILFGQVTADNQPIDAFITKRKHKLRN